MWRHVSLLLGCAVALAGLAQPAWAADKPGGHAAKPVYQVHLHHAGADGKSELLIDASDPKQAERLVEEIKHGNVHELKLKEEVSLLALKADLGLWSVVVFLVLFFLLRKYAWPQILEGLQAREKAIATAITEAQRAREEAARLEKQCQQQMAQAAEQVRLTLEEARRDAAATTEAMLAKARSEIKADRDRMLRELEAAKDAALQEIWHKAVDLATLLSAKALRQSVDVETHRRLFDEALAELNSQAKTMAT